MTPPFEPKPFLPQQPLNPSTGRTVAINNAVGLPVALKRLGHILKNNKVRRQVQLSKHHERGGLKRKRLKSERWRKRFREGFKATIKGVMEMKKQGW